MLLTVAILFFLFVGLYSGGRRGLVLQLVLTIGYLVSFLFAREYFQDLSTHLELLVPYPSASEGDSFAFYDQALGFQLDEAFYNGVAFILILFAGWLITRFIGGLLNTVTSIPVLKQLNALGGAVLGLVVNYVGVFLLLFLLSMIPLDGIQESFANSRLAQIIVQDTPRLSQQLYDWWIGTIG